MEKSFFGKMKTGEEISLYTIKNEHISLTVMEHGASIVKLVVRGIDVVCGFDTLEDYVADNSHQGAIIGRVANRISEARFELNGIVYPLPDNDNGACLHGGIGFSKRVFCLEAFSDTKITFKYISPDMEEGFPASLTVYVSYILKNDAVIIDYKAVPNGTTPVSLTNHAYFNLNGGGDILSHKLRIYSKRYTEVDQSLIPTGNRPSVIDTPFDFTDIRQIGERIENTNGGYDHNFLIFPAFFEVFLGKKLGLCAELWGEKIKMSVFSDQDGLQVYSGNFLGDGPAFKGQNKQIKHGALCLEAQCEPNSVKHGYSIYRKGEQYTQTTVYKFQDIQS